VKTKPKGIKKTIKILAIVFASFILLMAIPAVLLQFSKIQSAVVHLATEKLSEKLQTEIKIERVDYRFFNKLSIEGVYIEDYQKDTLVYVDKLYTGFDFFSMLKGKVAFSDIIIKQLYAHIKTDDQGNANYSFLFEPKKDDKELNINLKLDNLEIIDSEINYSHVVDLHAPIPEIQHRLIFKDIQTEIQINHITNDTINAQIKHLHTKELSGFELKNFAASIIGSPTALAFPILKIELPNSNIKLDGLTATIAPKQDSIKAIERFHIELPIKNLSIKLSDLGGLIPDLKAFDEQLKLNAFISGNTADLQFNNIRASYGKSMALQADLDLKNLTNLQQTLIQGDIVQLQTSTYQLQDLLAKINNKPVLLPQEIHRLGNIGFKGQLNGHLGNLITKGNFTTKIGNISSNLILKITNNMTDLAFDGSVRTSKFNLGNLLNDPKFGNIAFRLETKGDKKHKQAAKGAVLGFLSEFQFLDYTYSNAKLDGEFDGTGFNGVFEVKDDHIDASFLGMIDFKDKDLPVFDFDLKVTDTDLHALHLIKDYPDSKLSFNGITNMHGNHLDNLNGTLIMKQIKFENNNQTLNIDDFLFTSRTDENYSFLNVKSDYLNGSVSGNFKYSTIAQTFQRIIAQHLPAISKNGKQLSRQPNNVNLDLKLQNTTEIFQILELPYILGGEVSLKGNIDEQSDRIDLMAKVDTIQTKKQLIENLSIQLDNNNHQLQLVGRTQMINQHADIMNVYLSANAKNDNLSTRLMWQNNKEVTNAGEIIAKAQLKKPNKHLHLHAQIEPSEIIVSDSIWQMRASTIDFYTDSLLIVDNFLFKNEEQFIHIDGRSSTNTQDSLLVEMNDLNLDYVMNLLRLQGVNFGGFVTGDVKLFNILKEPILLGDLFVEDFSINESLISDAHLSSTWDKDYNRLVIEGDFRNRDDEIATAVGYYVPETDSLDIYIDAKKFPLDFLNRYFEGVASDFRGDVDGSVRIHGPTKSIVFEADAEVSKGAVKIDILNTTYYFDDKVQLTPYSIILNRIKLRDSDKNEANLTGRINHDGNFQDMVYDVVINSKKILGLNTTASSEEFFYGKAYLGGLVKIFGNDKETNVIINGTSMPGTKCYMSMGTASTALESDFIIFTERLKKPYEDNQPKGQGATGQSPFNVKVDMQIEITPDAEIDILVDPKAGDKITGRGNGNIRIVFDSFSDVELYGTVELEQGYYLFTLQTVIRKEFRVKEGSTLTWSGDPFSAQVNISGYYPLTASLADLIESDELRQITSRSTVPVHCVLNLTDDLMSPTIQFDIDLPSSDESVKSRVKNIINTEEMMNRQILYLMIFHKFFTPENIRTTAVGVNEGISFAMASTSAQINNYLQNVLNSDVLSLGFDWQKADVESDEVKAQILIQPNNRLIINGNIGYRNDNISENKFIGDFDLEYKLIESGRLRFMAYNHTIDRAQLREAKTTQGVGLMYREDFNNVPEMFVYYWDLIKGIFRKKEVETTNAP